MRPRMGRQVFRTPVDRRGSGSMFGRATGREEAESAGADDGVSCAGSVGDEQGVQDADVGEFAGVFDDGFSGWT